MSKALGSTLRIRYKKQTRLGAVILALGGRGRWASVSLQSEFPVLGKYYFPRKLYSHDCSLTRASTVRSYT